jgi:aspartyl protease family protein
MSALRLVSPMLRSVIAFAVLACVAATFAPSVLPGLLQGGSGTSAVSTPPAPMGEAPVSTNPANGAEGADGAIAEIQAGAGGQYSTDVSINGAHIRMLVDTGATFVAISAQTASRIGLRLSEADYTLRMTTANGVARAAPVMLPSVSVGDVYLPSVQGVAMEPRAGDMNLLGMSFLKRLSAVEQKSGRLILKQ